MCDPAGVHITRIYVNSSRESPSPIRSTKTVPVCTSTPIITSTVLSNRSPKKQAALLAKELLASQRVCSETFVRKPRSPSPQPAPEQFAFISKQTGLSIDLQTGQGLGKIKPETGTITKKKKQRHTLAVVPPAALSSRSSKSSDDGDYLVPMFSDMQLPNEKPKTNFTSYDGIQMFTFTLDDD